MRIETICLARLEHEMSQMTCSLFWPSSQALKAILIMLIRSTLHLEIKIPCYIAFTIENVSIA